MVTMLRLSLVLSVVFCCLGPAAPAQEPKSGSGVYFANGVMPEWRSFFSETTWHWSLLIVLLFRLFDIAKPWPVGPSQTLPGGWGVTIDDLLAALYVNLVMLLFLA